MSIDSEQKLNEQIQALEARIQALEALFREHIHKLEIVGPSTCGCCPGPTDTHYTEPPEID